MHTSNIVHGSNSCEQIWGKRITLDFGDLISEISRSPLSYASRLLRDSVALSPKQIAAGWQGFGCFGGEQPIWGFLVVENSGHQRHV
jgi:hypothetical protein